MQVWCDKANNKMRLVESQSGLALRKKNLIVISYVARIIYLKKCKWDIFVLLSYRFRYSISANIYDGNLANDCSFSLIYSSWVGCSDISARDRFIEGIIFFLLLYLIIIAESIFIAHWGFNCKLILLIKHVGSKLSCYKKFLSLNSECSNGKII